MRSLEEPGVNMPDRRCKKMTVSVSVEPNSAAPSFPDSEETPTRGTGVSPPTYKFFSACRPGFSSLIRTGTIVPLRCPHPLSQESTASPRPISRLSWSARHLRERRKRRGRAFPYQSRHILPMLTHLCLFAFSSCKSGKQFCARL